MQAVAARELREEAGLVAASWRSLGGGVQVCNGITDDVQHLFLARELTAAQAEPDGEEEIAVRWVPFSQAVEMAYRGEITECCSVAAILRAAHCGGAR